MNLPNVESLEVLGKKVIVRCDLDVGGALDSQDEERLKTSIKTIEYLLRENSKIIIIGHRGRPEGKIEGSLSLAPVAKKLSEILKVEIKFTYDIVGEEAKGEVEKLEEGEIIMLENLRFDSREEADNEDFVKSLATLADAYVNEAFADSHREHASIVGIPRFLPHAAGFRFVDEVENLSRIRENSKKPAVVILGGVKKDKLDYLEGLKKIVDKILVGGRLPEYLGDEAIVSVRTRDGNEKVIVGNLVQDKEDITLNTIERFEDEIEKAGTVILAGPMGKFEEKGHGQGTERVFKAVVDSGAFKVAGGGDTEAAISLLGIRDRFSWISAGGGAMLEFLAKGTMPGIEALR